MLAIAGGKGGVGKTTTALGLAAALPDRPLVVDADRDMPDLHALAGVTRGGSEDAAISDRVRLAEDRRCHVLPVPENEPPSVDRRLARVQAAWDGAADSPPVLIDTPAGASVDAAAPLGAADGVVGVSTACAPALRDATKTAAMARAVGTPVVGAMLTRTAVRPPDLDDLLGCPILGVIPEVTDRPLENSRVRERYETAASALLDATETFET